MKIGLQIPSFTYPGGTAVIGPRLAEIARTADEAGFASLWVMDHFFQIRGVGQPEEPMLEGYSALSFMAACTRRARLGTLVTGVIYRHRACWSKPCLPWMCCRAGGPTWGLGRPGTKKKPWVSACHFLPSKNASNAWKKRCKLPGRCGPAK